MTPTMSTMLTPTMSTMSTMSTPATTPGSGRTTPGSGRGRGQKRGRGRGGPKRARRQLHGPDEVPEWIRDRAPGEVFVHELKMNPNDKNWDKKSGKNQRDAGIILTKERWARM